MSDYPEATRIENRLIALNQLRYTANLVVPFLQEKFADEPPKRLANDSGWYKSTDKVLTEARKLIPFDKGNFWITQSNYAIYTHITLKTHYSVAEWGVNYIEQTFYITCGDNITSWEPLEQLTLDDILAAKAKMKDISDQISNLETALQTIKATYHPFFSERRI